MVKSAEQLGATTDRDWVPFPGGELEGPRPSALCPACRSRLRQSALQGAPAQVARPTPRTLCFECYRASLERERRLAAAAQLNTASEARFQESLPFDPVNHVRLKMLRAEREAARTEARVIHGGFDERRRRAQIAARHALRDAVSMRRTAMVSAVERERIIAAAVHAAELQLPAAWLPFVMAK
jgi:hypothetical protein